MPERLERDLLRNVPIFFGLKTSEMRRFLEVCQLTGLAAGDTLCSYGEGSRKCWVLLEGSLDVRSRDGTSVARLEPVQTVGEMGLVARRPRIATVRAISAVRLLEIGFERFDALLDSDERLRTCLYRNFIRVLGERLDDANDRAARYRRLHAEATGSGDSGTMSEPIADSSADGETRPESAPANGEQGPVAVGVGVPAEDHISAFFEFQRRLPGPEDMEEGRRVVVQLRDSGYSDADIEYAVKWTVRHIPSARRFGMVGVSIQEALEDKWSI